MDKSVGCIDVCGKDGSAALYRYFTYVGHIAEITSIPAYLAAKWLWEGKLAQNVGSVSPHKVGTSRHSTFWK